MKIYRIAKNIWDEDVAVLKEKAKQFETPEAYEEAHTSSNLMDLSDREKHRVERAFSEDKDTVESISHDTSLSGYLSTIKSAVPRTYWAIVNPGKMVRIYRAIPPTKQQLLNFFIQEKAKILHYGGRASYTYMKFLGMTNTSRYYDWLNSEIVKLEYGKSSFRLTENNSIQIGDYVSLDPSYSKMHGESVLVWEQKYPTYKLISKTVPKKDVLWGQADWNEWVYSPQALRDQYPGGLSDFYNKAKVELPQNK